MPVPANLPQFDKKTVTYLEEYDETSKTATADGRRKNVDEDDDEDMPRGQKVQCAQQ